VYNLLKHHGGAFDGVLWELARTAKADHAKERALREPRDSCRLVQFGNRSIHRSWSRAATSDGARGASLSSHRVTGARHCSPPSHHVTPREGDDGGAGQHTVSEKGNRCHLPRSCPTARRALVECEFGDWLQGQYRGRVVFHAFCTCLVSPGLIFLARRRGKTPNGTGPPCAPKEEEGSGHVEAPQ